MDSALKWVNVHEQIMDFELKMRDFVAGAAFPWVDRGAQEHQAVREH